MFGFNFLGVGIPFRGLESNRPGPLLFSTFHDTCFGAIHSRSHSDKNYRKWLCLVGNASTMMTVRLNADHCELSDIHHGHSREKAVTLRYFSSGFRSKSTASVFSESSMSTRLAPSPTGSILRATRSRSPVFLPVGLSRCDLFILSVRFQLFRCRHPFSRFEIGQAGSAAFFSHFMARDVSRFIQGAIQTKHTGSGFTLLVLPAPW